MKQESWDPQIAIILETIDLRTDKKMRWHFTLWNRTGSNTGCWNGLDDRTYVVDQDGNKYATLGNTIGGRFTSEIHSGGNFALMDNVKTKYQIDFVAPRPDAKTLEAHLWNEWVWKY